MKSVTRQEIVGMMKAHDVNLKPFFTVTFVKKDGTVRVLNGRCGVKRHVKGVGLSYDPASRGMVVVWEATQANRKDERDAGYRMVTVSRILSLKAHGEEFIPSD